MKISIYATDDVDRPLVREFDATDALGALSYANKNDRNIISIVIGFEIDEDILRQMVAGGVTINGTLTKEKSKKK